MPEEPKVVTGARPLLTLAIPTYNRARYLKELLSVLLEQLIDEPRVELIISDNASPDETPALIDEFRTRGLRLRHIRNQENIGPDANFVQCFEQARGTYVWLFGDDDIILPGGIARILTYLEKNEYDLVYLDSFPLPGAYTPRVIDSSRGVTILEDTRHFASRVHIFFTFISGNIINKDRVEASGPRSFAALVGSNLAQLGWTYAALNGFKRGLHIRDRLVGARVDNTGGYKLLQVFGPTLKSVTCTWLDSPHLRQIVFNGTLQRFWPGMLLQYKKSTDAFEREEKPHKVLASAFKNNFRYWTFVYPIIVLPSRLATGWLLLVRGINRIDRALGFILLRLGS